MSIEGNRLLLLWEKTLKDINREVINPVVEELKIDDLKPVIELVARARASFLKAMFTLSSETKEGLPSAQQIEELRQHRLRYEELSAASRALEVAIERGYLDVKK